MDGFEIRTGLRALRARQCAAGGTRHRLPLDRRPGLDGRCGLPAVPGHAAQPHHALDGMRGGVSVIARPPTSPTGRRATGRAADRLFPSRPLPYRTEPDGHVATLVAHMPARLNAPNDVVVKSRRHDLVHRSALRHPDRLRRRPATFRAAAGAVPLDPETGDIRDRGRRISKGRMASPSRPTNGGSTSPKPATRRGRSPPVHPASSLSRRTARAVRRRRCFTRSSPGTATACGSTRTATSGPAPATACIASARRRAARQGAGTLSRVERRLGRRLSEPPFHRRLAAALCHFPEPARGGLPVSGRRLRIAAIRLLCPKPGEHGALLRRRFRLPVRQGGGGGRPSSRRSAHRVRPGGCPARGPGTGERHDLPAFCDRGVRHGSGIRAIRAGFRLERDLARRTGTPAGRLRRRDGVQFRDCDGHPLELLAFRPDVVPPAWQGAEGRFSGSTIRRSPLPRPSAQSRSTVNLVSCSASRSLNQGPEQARLDAMDAPVLEVTGLRPPGGAPPHLELLCYRQPEPLCTTVPSDNVFGNRHRSG